MGIIVAVAAPAHALQCAVLGDEGFEAGNRVLAALVGVHDGSSRGTAHDQGPAQGLADKSSVIVSRMSQPTILREQQFSHTAR